MNILKMLKLLRICDHYYKYVSRRISWWN